MHKIGAIILGAGMSKRMGKPKLLEPLNNKPLFRYVLDVVIHQRLHPIIMIGGYDTPKIRKNIPDYMDVQLIYNPNYGQGISSSLKLGIETIKNKVDAVMIFLADQPFVTGHIIQSLIDCYEANENNEVSIVRPAYDRVPGHPVLFSAKLFSAFASLKGDVGGKWIIKNHSEQMKIVSFTNPWWGKDIDTPGDLLAMENYLNMSILPNNNY